MPKFSSPLTQILLPLLLITLLPSSKSYVIATSSIHETLRYYGLPGGLLPSSVESFNLDETSGLLEVRLNGPCYARYDDGLAFFEPVVRGNLSYGALRGVVGWVQKELFLWLPVKGILVSDQSSGVILFDIGVAHKRLPASSFEDPPECRPEWGSIAVRPRKGSYGRKEGLQKQR